MNNAMISLLAAASLGTSGPYAGGGIDRYFKVRKRNEPRTDLDIAREFETYKGKTLQHKFTGQVRYVAMLTENGVNLLQDRGHTPVPKLIFMPLKKFLQWARKSIIIDERSTVA